jgi:hypothetical protein
MALTEAQRSTLRRLSSLWQNLEFALIGASAIKIWRPDYLRETWTTTMAQPGSWAVTWADG